MAFCNVALNPEAQLLTCYEGLLFEEWVRLSRRTSTNSRTNKTLSVSSHFYLSYGNRTLLDIDSIWTSRLIRKAHAEPKPLVPGAFEFIEHSKLPKLTPKLTFLFQTPPPVA